LIISLSELSNAIIDRMCGNLTCYRVIAQNQHKKRKLGIIVVNK